MSLFQRLLQKFDKSNIDLSAKTPQTEMPILPIAVDSAAQIEFFRVGNDLVIKILGDSQPIQDYFLKPVALKTLDGEILSVDDIISSLSYPTQPVLLAANGEIEAIGSAKAIQIGTITKIVEGPITAQAQDGASRTLNEGDQVYQHDIVSTVARSYVKISLEDGTVFQLGPFSRMSLDKYAFDSQNSMGEVKANIFSGFFRYISGKISGKNEGEHTVIQTPSADIGIRGSEIEARVEPDGSLNVLHLSGLINIISRHSLGEVMVYEPGTVVYIPNNNTSHTLKTLTEEQIQLRIQEWQVLENQDEVESQLIKSMGVKEISFLGVHSDPGDEITSLSPDFGALNPFSPATVDIHSDDSVDNLIREHFEMDTQVKPVAMTPVHEESYFYSTNYIPKINYLPSVPTFQKRESDGITERFDEGLPALDETVLSVEETILPVERTVLPADNPLLFDPTPSSPEKVLPSTSDNPSPLQLPKLLTVSFNEDNSQIFEAQGVHITDLIQPQQGSVFNNEDGTLIYTPRSDFIGEDSFSYSLNGQDFIEVPVTVKPMQIEIPESRLVGELTQPQHGRVIDNGDGTLTYLPNPDFYGDDFFTITVQDPVELGNQSFSILQVEEEANTIRVELSITTVNDVPQGVDDIEPSPERSTIEDIPLVMAPAVLLQNDINVDGDILSIQNVQSSELTYGQVSLNNSGEVVYLPTANFHGQAEFFYTVQDDAGVSDAKVTRVTVMVSPSDDVPVAVTDTFVISNTNKLNVSTTALLDNDQEFDSEILRIVGVRNPSGGTVRFDGNEEIEFAPKADFVTGGFNYIVSDGQHTDVGQVVIIRDNFQPVAQDDELKLDQAVVPVTIDAGRLLANDTDPENDRLSIVRVNDDSGDRVAMDNWGNIIFTPHEEFIDSGLSRFTYQVSDEKGNTAIASVTVVLANQASIEDINQPDPADQPPVTEEEDVNLPDTVPVDTSNERPIAKNDNIKTHTPPDPVSISVSELLKNDIDPENDTLSLTPLDEDSLNGRITVDDRSGDIVFTPSDSFIDEGFGQWRYEINDGHGNTATALVTMTLINEPPVAKDEVFDLGHDEQITITSEALLDNDSDPDGDSLTLLITDSFKGQATLDAEGNVVFARDSEFEGKGGFEYQISDGKGGVATAQVTLTGLVNQDPVVNDDEVGEPVPKNQAAVLPITFLLNNDFDPDPNDQLSLVEVKNAINGQVEWQEDTNPVIFTPSPGFTGEASFEYTIKDEQGARATAQVNLEVINTPPVAIPDDPNSVADLNILADTSLTLPAAKLLLNDNDANGDEIAVVSVSSTLETHGSVTLDNDNVIFKPEPGFEGKASFDYTIEDSDNAQDTATVTVAVVQKMGTDDTFTISKNTTETIPATELLANDHGQRPISITDLGNAENGVVQLNMNGDVQFTPDSDFIGEARFEYALLDTLGRSDKATVIITVENIPPIAEDDEVVTTENIEVSIPTANLLLNDRDDDIGDEELTLIAVNNANHGTVELNENGDEVLFTPDQGFAGEARFEYTIVDNSGAEATATVMVTVNPANRPPEITLPNSSTPLVYNIYDNPLPIDNAATVTDPDSADFESGELKVTITTHRTLNDVLEIQNQDRISVSDPTGGEIFFEGNPIGTFSTHFLTGALLINLTANADQEATASLLQTITYKNTSTEPATDTRTVEITLSDGDGGTSIVASRDIEVTTSDPPPIAVDDNIAIPFNLSTTFPAEELLTNDSDPNPDDQLSISEVSSANPEEVNVTLIGQEVQLFINGLLNEHFDPVTFDYIVSDDNGGENSATVTVTPTNIITGTPNADDNLKGTEQLDIILGQAGNDTFAPNVGPDILLGGNGDDTFLFDPDVAAGIHFKGNEGTDTLKFTGTEKQLDLTRNTALPSDQQVDLQEIEKIDLGETESNELRLSITDVLDISDSNNLLTIEGNLNSSVISVGQGWNFRGTDTDGSYNRYTNGDAELLVSVDIARQFIS